MAAGEIVVAEVDMRQGILNIANYGLGNASRWNPLAYVDCRECVAFNFAHRSLLPLFEMVVLSR
jgi:hypothetical protein